MTFINTAYAALRLVVSAIAGFIPAMQRDLGTIGAALSGGSARPSSQMAVRAALRLVAFVVVVLLVYPALRNVYVMEFISNPLKAATEANALAFSPYSIPESLDYRCSKINPWRIPDKGEDNNKVYYSDESKECVVFRKEKATREAAAKSN